MSLRFKCGLGRGAAVAAAGCFALMSYAPAHAEDVGELHMRITNSYLQEMAPGIALDYFAKRVSELSDGQMTVEVFHGGSLYTEGDSIQAVLDGTIQMGLASSSNHSPFTKTWRVIEAPYLFANRKQFREVVIRGPLREKLVESSHEDGLHPVMILETGGFRILGTNELVKSPDDLNNMKIRVPQSPVPLTFWENAGANPTVVPWSETYLALGQGTVNGLDASYSSWYLANLWEVTDYVTDVAYSPTASVTDVRLDWWQGLSQKQRDIISKAAHEAEDVSMREEDRWEAKIKKAMRKNGMEIYTPNEAEMKEWREIGRATWDELPDIPQDLLQQFNEAAKAVGD